MKKLNKTLTMVLVIAFMLLSTLTGCGTKQTENNSEDIPTIGIVQISEHTSLNMIRESILAQLESDGFFDGKNINIDYQNAQGDQSNLKTICQQFSSKNYDLIIAIATPSAQAALGETTEIPIVFSAVTDPIDAGLVTSMQQPGGNITGTSDAVSPGQIMDLAKQITPDFKTVGVLYNSGEPNSLSVIKDLKIYAEENNLTILEAPVMNGSEAPQAASSLVKKADIVFSPIDNTIASAMPIITETLNKAKIPFYVSADSMVMDGGLATYGINYKTLGAKTGEMVSAVLNGTDPGSIDIETISDMQTYINTDTAEKIGITIPESILKSATLFTDEDSSQNQ
ncbi:ABC transporter substrate-binding protein [Sinanaerobacter sp. ZZT-01]|uniref:ABC transporter substrate-binding protein n=1 Tax=Sinanaerobacter sp. ZZT-01 TaxID=3111540 RepID=UPI002D7842AD|nr:ABC transporter substrate-binding protein [Sinanaerobacter sp. ZZT-01]WRR93418.1 ABC transporter substrate-binding protein [Sinanaerobacter sp. ZZT-01]